VAGNVARRSRPADRALGPPARLPYPVISVGWPSIDVHFFDGGQSFIANSMLCARHRAVDSVPESSVIGRYCQSLELRLLAPPITSSAACGAALNEVDRFLTENLQRLGGRNAWASTYSEAINKPPGGQG
jgi:hypothetical protein